MLYPLEDVKVLDLSHALAGPYCTLLLADYGARVYKLEPPEAGDMGRGWGPPFAGDQASYFVALHPNKLGLCLDLKHPEGRELCLRLMEKVDVVIENFRPGTPERLGLGWETARRRNARLIYCSISGYGQDGPSRDLPAMDLILQASSGLMSITGPPGGPLVRCGHSVADITSGMSATIGILIALRARDATGAGQYLDVAMFDSMISAMVSNFGRYLGSGVVPGPMGSAFDQIVPYCGFATADRDIVIAIGSEKLWDAFCRALERPNLAADPRFASNAERVRNRAVLEPLLAEIFRTASSEEWLRRLGAAGVPCTLVRTLEEVCADPQATARGMFPVLPHPSAGPTPVTGLPIKMSATPGRVRFPAPVLGQHTRAVLHALLCLDNATLDRLAADGVIFQGTTTGGTP
jgi:crotonobetainyl-CoA:carnitine CoA-transferase CaiB-like acyl-CoA transferase